MAAQIQSLDLGLRSCRWGPKWVATEDVLESLHCVFSVRFMVDANLNLAGSSTPVFLLHKLPKLSIINEFIMRVLIRPTQTSCLEGYQGRLGEEFSMTWDSAPNTEIKLQQRSTYTLSFANSSKPDLMGLPEGVKRVSIRWPKHRWPI